MNLTKEQFDILMEEVDKFNDKRGFRDVDYGDIIFTYFYPDMILNDFDEGEINDPYWDKETNTHSCIKFINDTVALIRK